MNIKRIVVPLICMVVLATGMVQAKTTISFWHGYSELEAIYLNENLIPLFESMYPEYEVESVNLGYDELKEKVITTAAAGSGPDVMRLDIIWTPEMAAAGLLEPLDRYEGFDEYLGTVYPGPLTTNLYQGKYYGLPLTTNTQVYIYNEEMFSRTALVPPETMDDFLAVSNRLTQTVDGRTTVYGYDIGGPWAWHLFPWIWSNGGAITDPAISVADGYLNSERTIQTLDMIVEWATRGILSPTIYREGYDRWGSLVNGQLGALQDGPWFGTWVEANHPDFSAGYSLVPHAPGVTSTSVVGGENIAIAGGSQNKAAAWQFVKFMLSMDVQSGMATVGQVPVIRDAVQIPLLRESKYYPVFLEQIATANARPPHPKYTEIENVVQEAFWQVISGENSAAAVLEEATRLVDGLLSGN